jgi:hypothetical protein
MNGPTKTVEPPWTPLPARKIRGVLENVLDNADAVIDGIWIAALMLAALLGNGNGFSARQL